MRQEGACLGRLTAHLALDTAGRAPVAGHHPFDLKGWRRCPDAAPWVMMFDGYRVEVGESVWMPGGCIWRANIRPQNSRTSSGVLLRRTIRGPRRWVLSSSSAVSQRSEFRGRGAIRIQPWSAAGTAVPLYRSPAEPRVAVASSVGGVDPAPSPNGVSRGRRTVLLDAQTPDSTGRSRSCGPRNTTPYHGSRNPYRFRSASRLSIQREPSRTRLPTPETVRPGRGVGEPAEGNHHRPAPQRPEPVPHLRLVPALGHPRELVHGARVGPLPP